MRNAVLHLITNKAKDFGIEGLPLISSFVPATPTEAESKIRKALLINDSPYHLINSLSAVYAFEEILAEFNESSRTFELYSLPRNYLHITGADYANTASENFNIAYSPSSFVKAGTLAWKIKYNNSTSINLIYAGISVTIPFSIDSNKVLSATWPLDSGIRGGFKIPDDKEWSIGSLSEISLNVAPVSFSYADTIAYLKRFYSNSLYGVLNESGLGKNFAAAQSAIEQYAIVMLAIGKPDIRNTYVSTC
jgi:hypothetical protein